MGTSRSKRAPGKGFELSEKEKDAMASRLWGDPANLEVYDPGAKKRIPEAGAWGLITRKLPALEGGVDKEIKVGRIFYLERQPNADSEGFSPRGLYKALLRSPWGDLQLWPYEYSTIEPLALTEMWTAGELVFHPLSIDGARFQEISFYARSRGIALADAAVMALGTLSGNVGWFEPRADLAEECEAMERSVHSTVWSTRLSRAEKGAMASMLPVQEEEDGVGILKDLLLFGNAFVRRQNEEGGPA